MSRILEPTSPEMSRPRGRPRSFDEREALQKAIRVFWAKGYDAVTVDDLVAGMGVARPSLYAVFGDKAALFMRSLRAYAEGLGGRAMKALLGPPSVHDGIRALFAHAVKSATTEGSPAGCLLVCVAPAVDDPAVRNFLVQGNAQAVALVDHRLRGTVDACDMAHDFPGAVLALHAVDRVARIAILPRHDVYHVQV